MLYKNARLFPKIKCHIRSNTNHFQNIPSNVVCITFISPTKPACIVIDCYWLHQVSTFNNFFCLLRKYGSREGSIQKYISNPQIYFKSSIKKFFKSRNIFQIHKYIFQIQRSFSNPEIYFKSGNVDPRYNEL